MLRDVEPSAQTPLITVLPASTLIQPSTKQLRTELFSRWDPGFVGYVSGGLLGVHSAFQAAVLQLVPISAGRTPFRLFEAPSNWRESYDLVTEDLRRLFRMRGGSTQFGYILQDPPPFGSPLGFQQNSPDIRRRTEELEHYGRTTYLDHLFDIFAGRPRQSYESREPFEAGASRLATGRDVMRSSAIAPVDEGANWVLANEDKRLISGDILVRSIQDFRNANTGLVWARVEQEDLPLAPGPDVLVLRPRANTSQQDIDFVLRYLSSRHARELSGDPWVQTRSVSHVTARTLASMRVPMPDEQLADALHSVEEARRTADKWGAEADAILASLFEHDDSRLSRQTVIERSRTVRLRVQAVHDIESLSGQVRTQYPLPIAFRWRSMEAIMSSGPSRLAYQSALDTAEQVLAFTACVCLAIAAETDIAVSAITELQRKLAKGQGLGLGDWNAVLDEVRGRAFEPMNSVVGSTELRDFCRDEEMRRTRRTLTNRRNDEYHGRKVSEAQLPTACDEIRGEMSTLLSRLDFFLDNPLIITENLRWDSIDRSGVLSYRRLAGDHPIVPIQQMRVSKPTIESGSLYLLDSTGELHLLRPFLLGMTCAECGNFSTFHVDRVVDGTVRVKSLEHGHGLAAPPAEPALRSAGLLPGLKPT